MARVCRRVWEAKFLVEMRAHGGFYHSARCAGIHPATAWRRHDRDPEFARLVREAREEHADQLEREIEEQARKSGNPVGFIVRLKALRPHEYIERHAVMSVSMTAEIPGPDAAHLLREMLANLTDSSRQLLSSGPPQTAPLLALPAPDDDAHDSRSRDEPEQRLERAAPGACGRAAPWTPGPAPKSGRSG